MKVMFTATLLLVLALLFGLQTSYAGSATWNLDPTGGYWNAAENWTPATVPNGPDDIATFVFSNIPSLKLGPDTEANSIVFASDATAFTISRGPNVFDDRSLTLSGAGIINNSTMVQNFVVEVNFTGARGSITFVNSASAGTATTFTVLGAFATGQAPGLITFSDSSTAGEGTFMLQPGAQGGPALGAQINFDDNASAGNGTFIVNGALRDSPQGGRLTFSTGSTGDHGVFVNNGGTGSNSGGGLISFIHHTSAGFGTYTNNGGDRMGAGGATLTFSHTASAAQSTLIANGGLHGGDGAVIQLQTSSDASLARIELFDNGALDIHSHSLPGATIGSLEGDGIVFLGGKRLSVGGTNRDTIFAGLIKGGVLNGEFGAVTKEGTGQLVLSGGNIYTGGTDVTDGVLFVSNRTGSATGTGPVVVSGGTLGGGGLIGGVVTIGAGANLEPSVEIKQTATLTIEDSLTLETGSTYTCKLRSNRAAVDQVIANGVTIESGAQMLFSIAGHGQLSIGSVFTVIDNNLPEPISGTFVNLPDGSIFTANGNNFQVSYEGGDGNNLTLTVVP